MKIESLMRGINVQPLAWALRKRPELWDQITARTIPADSPHHGCSDIWIRYYADGQDPTGPHDSAWYPAAAVLPVRELIFPLMAQVQATRLGGVLITRIPPGHQVRPHTDPGWHARFYEKFAISIEAAPGQVFHVEDEQLETQPGECFWFDNAYQHWVLNPTPYERVTLIICMNRS